MASTTHDVLTVHLAAVWVHGGRMNKVMGSPISWLFSFRVTASLDPYRMGPFRLAIYFFRGMETAGIITPISGRFIHKYGIDHVFTSAAAGLCAGRGSPALPKVYKDFVHMWRRAQGTRLMATKDPSVCLVPRACRF